MSLRRKGVPLNEKQTSKKGFTLIELLLALSFGSFIILSSAKIYPHFRYQTKFLQESFRLDQAMRQLMFSIEKDLRRAGFCNGQCPGMILRIGQYPGEMKNSCIILSFDLNKNGKLEGEQHRESEYFGYRLRKGVLEIQRGQLHCSGHGWEKISDPQEIKITHFSITQLPKSRLGTLFKTDFFANNHTKKPPIQRQINSVINNKNL